MDDGKIWIVMESGYNLHYGIPYVNLYSRNYNDKFETATHSFQYNPYFYCPANESHRMHELIVSVDPEVTIDAKGREIQRVNVKIPQHVPKVRDIYSWTDESDVIFDKRFLVDHKIRYAYTIVDGLPTPVEVEHIMEPRIVYFDIETRAPEGVFPNAKDAEYPVVSIQVMDSYTEKIGVFTYQIGNTGDPCQVYCENEKELFLLFCAYVKEINPDIMAAWNSDQYDIPYLINRATNIGITLSGIPRYGTCSLKYDPILGKFRCYTPGRAFLDEMEAFKKYNIGKGQRESNGLKSVISDEELLEDAAFSYQDIAPILDKIINEERYDEFISYCKNDVIALHVIDKKLGLYNFFETTRSIAGNKIMDGLHNSLIIEMYVMHEGIRPMPRKQYGGDKDKFKGALVVEPTFGIHEWVATVDLNALYPHIIVGFSVSPDIDGVVAKSTKKLMDLREMYREQKKQGMIGASARDSSCKSLVNSVFGIMGAPSARLYDRSKAEFITRTGQELNRYIQKLCKDIGKNIMYGDSVGSDTEVKVYNSLGEWKYTTVEELFTQVDFIRDDKEYCNLTDCFVESIDEDGKLILDEVPYIMRHKCGKQMYNIQLTTDWSIDVTEDHSLFVYLTKAVLPKAKQKYRIGTCSTKELGEGKLKSVIIRRSTMHSIINSIGKPLKFYEYLGYHIGNGTLHYNAAHHNGNAYYGGISYGDDVDTLYPYFTPFMEKEGYYTNIYFDKRGGTHTGDIKYSGLEFIRFIEEHIGHSHDKRIPEFMLYESIENIQAFIRGYFTADGTVMFRNKLPILRLTSTNKQMIEDMQHLMYIVGIPTSYFTESKPNSYNGKVSNTYSSHLTVSDIEKFRDEIGFLTTRKQERLNGCNPPKVEKGLDWSYSSAVTKTEISYDGYVYDLHCKQTNRYFANNILVHNTDSVFISPIENGAACIELEKYLNEELAKWSDEKGSSVHFKLKAEKLFRRLLFKSKSTDRNKTGKKKYAGHLIWEEGVKCNELKFMGLEIKRSDNPKIIKECLLYFLESAIIEGSINKATNHVKDLYQKVRSGKVDIYDISLPKELRKLKYDKKNSWLDGKEYAKTEYDYIIQEGEKPRLVYLTNNRVICIDDGFDVSKIMHDVDWKVMAEKTIKDKMESYMWSIGLSWESAINGQNTLDAWF